MPEGLVVFVVNLRMKTRHAAILQQVLFEGKYGVNWANGCLPTSHLYIPSEGYRRILLRNREKEKSGRHGERGCRDCGNSPVLVREVKFQACFVFCLDPASSRGYGNGWEAAGGTMEQYTFVMVLNQNCKELVRQSKRQGISFQHFSARGRNSPTTPLTL